MYHQQKEPNGLQGLPLEEMLARWHVQERLSLRSTIQLVQDSLPTTGTTTGTSSGRQQPQWSTESASFVTEFTESNATSILRLKPLLKTALHERRIDDVEVG